jgi:hypothetical protein
MTACRSRSLAGFVTEILSCPLVVTRCLPECVNATAAVPQIAADLLHRQSWQPWVKRCHSRLAKARFAPAAVKTSASQCQTADVVTICALVGSLATSGRSSDELDGNS